MAKKTERAPLSQAQRIARLQQELKDAQKKEQLRAQHKIEAAEEAVLAAQARVAKATLQLEAAEHVLEELTATAAGVDAE